MSDGCYMSDGWQTRIIDEHLFVPRSALFLPGPLSVCLELDKLETTPLRVVVSCAYLVFSQPPACLHQAM